MRKVFVDTEYWVARFNPKDQRHGAAVKAWERFEEPVQLFTTMEVLIEVLTSFCECKAEIRKAIVEFVESLFYDPSVTVIDQTSTSFWGGLNLYRQRADKEYSMADCISMHWMKVEQITEVLTHDHHFRQEGFIPLIQDR